MIRAIAHRPEIFDVHNVGETVGDEPGLRAACGHNRAGRQRGQLLPRGRLIGRCRENKLLRAGRARDRRERRGFGAPDAVGDPALELLRDGREFVEGPLVAGGWERVVFLVARGLGERDFAVDRERAGRWHGHGGADGAAVFVPCAGVVGECDNRFNARRRFCDGVEVAVFLEIERDGVGRHQ